MLLGRIEFIVKFIFLRKKYIYTLETNRGPSERTSIPNNNRERRGDPYAKRALYEQPFSSKTWPNVTISFELEYYLNTLYLFRFQNVCIFFVTGGSIREVER